MPRWITDSWLMGLSGTKRTAGVLVVHSRGGSPEYDSADSAANAAILTHRTGLTMQLTGPQPAARRWLARWASCLALLLIASPVFGQLGDKFGDPFGDPFANEDPPVTVEVASNAESVAPGGQFVVAAILDHAEHWHSHLNEPIVPPEMEGFVPIATRVVVTSAGEIITAGPIQWPEPHAVEVAFTGTPVEYLVYEGRAIVYVPLLVNQDAAVGESIELSIEIEYQACDDVSCDLPMLETRTLSIAIVEPSEAATLENADFDGFDPSVFAEPWDEAGSNTKAVASPAQGSNFFGVSVPGWDTPVGLAILALLAALGGLILNLTPCVLPVIPIKIMTISQHAGSPGKSLYLGLWMFAGWSGSGSRSACSRPRSRSSPTPRGSSASGGSRSGSGSSSSSWASASWARSTSTCPTRSTW
jgi:hypothetical protein